MFNILGMAADDSDTKGVRRMVIVLSVLAIGCDWTDLALNLQGIGGGIVQVRGGLSLANRLIVLTLDVLLSLYLIRFILLIIGERMHLSSFLVKFDAQAEEVKVATQSVRYMTEYLNGLTERTNELASLLKDFSSEQSEKRATMEEMNQTLLGLKTALATQREVGTELAGLLADLRMQLRSEHGNSDFSYRQAKTALQDAEYMIGMLHTVGLNSRLSGISSAENLHVERLEALMRHVAELDRQISQIMQGVRTWAESAPLRALEDHESSFIRARTSLRISRLERDYLSLLPTLALGLAALVLTFPTVLG